VTEFPARPLIGVEALAGLVDERDPRLVLIDARWYLGKPGAGRAAYDAGHLPGAIFLDLDADLSDPNGFGAPGRHPLPSPEEFARRMGAAGIGDDSHVIAYDDVGGWVAARLWWMLDDLGFRDVAVLDGGIAAWVADGQPLSTVAVHLPARELHLAERWTRVIARDDLRRQLGSLTLLDARAAPRYRGEVEPVDPVAGHIPTALSAPYEANLGADGRFLPREELRRRFEGLAGNEDVDVVTSCGSGTSAAHHALAMRVAGLPDPILYVGSYSDWSRSGYAVVTGPEPGTDPGTEPGADAG
jgi:thiosulfate/3-mercaptopyruvate sulfurtransferase